MKLDALLNPATSSSVRSSPPSHERTVSVFSRIDNHTRLPYPRNNSTSSHGSSPARSPTSSSVPPLDRSNSSDSAKSTSPISTPVAEHLDYAYARFPPKSLVHLPPAKQNITLPPVRPHIEHLAASSSSHFGRQYPSMAGLPSDSYPSTPASAATNPEFGFPSAPPSAYGRPPMAPQTAPAAFLPQQPYLTQGGQLPPHMAQPAALYQQPGPVNTASKSTKKNSYPCPVAKQYNCNEFFTTSGHAARHAKKHTGKKDAICPECGKAFTRKDNMEQHRRTHSGNRSNNTNSLKRETAEEAAARRAKQQQRKTRPSSISTASPAPTNADFAMLDPQLRDSPVAGLFPGNESDLSLLGLASQQPLPPPTAMMRPDLQQTASAVQALHARQASLNGLPQYPSPPASSPSVAPALDALALAASRQNDDN